MKKLKSSLVNMVLVLCLISAISASLLAWMNALTKEPIEMANHAKKEAAIKEVLPAFDNNPVSEKIEWTDADGEVLTCYPAKQNGRLVGMAVESYSLKGFNGRIEVMVGFTTDGTIHNYSVLKQSETPGLGTKMVDWFKTEKGDQNIKGKHPAKNNLSVKKENGEIDAITAATISSKAFTDAIARAYAAYVNNQ